MSKKVSKVISINEMDTYMENSCQKSDTENWCGMELTTKCYLSLSEMITFVDSVKQCCFAEDGTYRPELKDFAVRKCVVEMYSNVRLPKNIDKQYEVLISSGVFDKIMTKINYQQYSSMLSAIEQKIENELNNAQTAAQIGLTKLTNDFNTAIGQFTEVLDSVSNDDIQKIASSVKDGKVDEASLMRAYMAERRGEGEDVITEQD